ncbi:FadR/GntR family transcriptional regulator [Stappia indica]|uniref:FadR/GntR family transcriptional regulator n=1 Tax=Stappia indica TaxID=538381 RepID=UPI001CD434BC|nr:FCD domain-containing protein [Stappia indica]MCA1298778.1 FCD domain-containing protein [Stappia indica]
MTGTDKPAQRNSSLALERLRILIDEARREGREQLATERELAEEIGVGRRAVRRALDVLETEGRIWRRQGAGTFIGPEPGHPERQIARLPKMSNMLEVMEVRLRIEPILAQFAALRATPTDVAAMRELAARVASAEDMDSRELWDSALHRAIASAAGNTLFLTLFDVVDRVRQDTNWRHVREALRSRETITLYMAQHTEVIDAIERRDPIAAELAMRQHLLALQERLLFQSSANPPETR